MESPPSGQITQLLVLWRQGKHEALDQLIPLVYPELHRIAERYMRRERPNHTLQASALIHEGDSRKSQIVEMRFFGGLSLEDTAQALGISIPTVERQWRAARIWLHKAMTSGGQHDS